MSKVPRSMALSNSTEKYNLRKKPVNSSQNKTLGANSPASSIRCDDLFKTPSKSPSKSGSSTPSNFVCTVCKGAEALRNLNLQQSIQKFTAQIEQISATSEILKDSNFNISHITDVLKHFIMIFDSNDEVPPLRTVISNLNTELSTLPNYDVRFTELENLIVKYTDKQNCHHNKNNDLFSDLIKSNNEKLSSVSHEIELLKSYISSLESKNSDIQRPQENKDLVNEKPFKITNSGQRVISPWRHVEENPTTHVKSYEQDIMPDHVKSSLLAFLSEKTVYHTSQGQETATFGNQYTHLKSLRNHKNVEIPNEIRGIINLVDPENTQNYNSVVIRIYSHEMSYGDNSFIDRSIRPESDICTINIGAPADIVFKDKVKNQEQILSVRDNSYYIMSQHSQFYWCHRLDNHSITSGSGTPHYTITFLCTGRFRNSTLIIGDSNTYNVKFHDEQSWSSPGKYITGKRYTCYVLEDIDPAKCLDYRNIVFHVGINNLKDRYNNIKDLSGQVNVDSVFNSWLNALIKLRNTCPFSKIIVSPILPTKIRALNTRAVAFNRLLFSCVNKFWHELDFNSFVNESGLLDDNFGKRYNVNTGVRDRIHLGYRGISRLGLLFRDAILGKPGSLGGRLYSDATRGSGDYHVS